MWPTVAMEFHSYNIAFIQFTIDFELLAPKPCHTRSRVFERTLHKIYGVYRNGAEPNTNHEKKKCNGNQQNCRIRLIDGIFLGVGRTAKAKHYEKE